MKNIENNALVILKNTFKDRSKVNGEHPIMHMNEVLHRKATELMKKANVDIIDESLVGQPIIYHFDQINYSLEYEIFRQTKRNDKKVQKIRQSLMNLLDINISIHEGFNELYSEDFDPEEPPNFVYIPSKNLMRKMVVDAVLEM